MATKLIALETRRYSAMFRRILEQYGEGATIRVDGRKVTRENELAELIEKWCTNARIKQTRNFRVEKGGKALFGFHDHPSETWAALSELPFAEVLQKEGVARYRVLPVGRGVFDRLFASIVRQLRGWLPRSGEND